MAAPPPRRGPSGPVPPGSLSFRRGRGKSRFLDEFLFMAFSLLWFIELQARERRLLLFAFRSSLVR